MAIKPHTGLHVTVIDLISANENYNKDEHFIQKSIRIVVNAVNIIPAFIIEKGEKIIEARPIVILPHVKVIHEYRHLEFQVQQILDKFCNAYCKLCAACCCRKEICDESIDSAWLSLVWQNSDLGISNYNTNTGWLTEHGCKLRSGRPPVCYDFFCNTIVTDICANPDSSEALKKIAHVVAFSGKNALGAKHLVTLTEYQILHQLNYQKLSHRIAKSLVMLGDYQNILCLNEVAQKFPAPKTRIS